MIPILLEFLRRHIHFFDIFTQLLSATYACKQHLLSCTALSPTIVQQLFYPNPCIAAGASSFR
jgi:hypothetical protein